MIDFGLCLGRELTLHATALKLNVCDNRTEATFLCAHDDLDFALKTYLNRDFIGMTFCWTKYVLYSDLPAYVYNSSPCNQEAFEELAGEWTEEKEKLIQNRKPRRIK